MASRTTAQTTLADTYMDRHPKRRRLSLRQAGSTMSIEIPPEINALREQHTDQHADGMADIDIIDNTDRRIEDKDTSIGISATSKLAGQTVAPFLAKHIPGQYAPLGDLIKQGLLQTKSKHQVLLSA
jgi:hypothetical protein